MVSSDEDDLAAATVVLNLNTEVDKRNNNKWKIWAWIANRLCTMGAYQACYDIEENQ